MAWFNSLLPRLSKARGVSRRRQGGFLSLWVGMGGRRFTASDLFSKGEPGAHFEAYDPNTLLRRRNLLTWSEDFTNAAWTKHHSSVAAAPGVSNPFGTTTYKITEAATTETHGVRQSFSFRVGAYHYQFWAVKAAERAKACIFMYAQASSEFVVDLTTGQPDAPSVSRVNSYGVSDLGDGWWLIAASWVAGTATAASLILNNGASNVYTGDGASGLYVAHAQLGYGTVLGTEYQPVTDWNIEYMAAALESIGMWQDAAGTTPVTTVEQPVGLWLDTKVGPPQRGPEKVTNGGFDTSAGWTTPTGWAITGGKAVHTPGTGTNTQLYSNAGIQKDKTYEVVLTVSGRTAGSLTPQVGAWNSGPAITSNGAFKQIIVAAHASTSASIVFASDTLFDGSVDDVSVRELPGNHATQATPTSRMVLSARYNRLTKTEQFDDVIWLKVAATTPVRDTLKEDGTAAAQHYASSNDVPLEAGTNVALLEFKAGEGSRNVAIRVAGASGSAYAIYNPSTGALVLSSTSGSGHALVSASAAQASADGFFRAWIKVTSTETSAFRAQIINGTALQYDGDNASSVKIRRGDFRTADDAALNIPAYQRVNTATDYDTEGFPHYLRPDGVDDSGATGNIDFTGTDKMTVWAGVTKLSDAATGMLVELSANSGSSNPGSWYISAPESAGAVKFSFRTIGTDAIPINASTGSSDYNAPKSAVVTGIGRLSDSTRLRLDGVQIASVGGSYGGNFGNYPINIGRRDNSAFPFNGRIYSITVRGAASSDGEIRRMERYIANRMGKVLA